MQALASLQRDHRMLLQLTNALLAFASSLADERAAHSRDLLGFADVFRRFADDLHYEKEEQVLIPLLVRYGFDWDSEVLAHIRHEHCQERYLIDVLWHAAQRSAPWNEHERRRVVATAIGLGESQNRLLLQQDVELFPEIVTRLDASALEEIDAELAHFDELNQRRTSSAGVLELGRELILRYEGRLALPDPRAKARYDA
jgi:hemerythrin-like domain-containing protein